MVRNVTRRSWMKQFSGCLLAAGLAKGRFYRKGSPVEAVKNDEGSGMNIYFGDLHNHNEVGYAKGSLERSFDIAASHLDFYALTPHSHWHDMPRMAGDKHLKWVKGFAVTRRRWPEVQQMVRDYHKPGEFVTFPAYEWHSSYYGDYCIVFPTDDSPLTTYDTLTELQEFAYQKGALLIPHHPAYRQGRRGANPRFWDKRVTNLLEISSEHGNAECDEGPFDYIRHSMGGRWTPNTLQAVLESGHRVGVLASTDDHLGYPGAYGEGLAAIVADELTRESLFAALKKRRCYGVTGDRIRLHFRLNGRFMGEEIPFAGKRDIRIAVTAWDEIDRVEVLKNNRVVYRDFPADRRRTAFSWSKPVLLRLEYGWGPWAALGMPRVCDWDIKVELQGGDITEVQPAFQSGPLDEGRRNLVSLKSGKALEIKSYTSRLQAFAERATNSVVLRVRGGPDTVVTVATEKPSRKVIKKKLSQLAAGNEVVFTGPFPEESLVIHRLVPGEIAATGFNFSDEGSGERVDWYYVRVVQRNGHLAWSSPVWVEKKTV